MNAPLTQVYTKYILSSEEESMKAKIQKWGNSQGVRLSKTMLDEIGLSCNDEVEITRVGNIIQISKPVQHKTLEERLEGFYGMPLKKIVSSGIANDNDVEIDWGAPVGEEVW